MAPSHLAKSIWHGECNSCFLIRHRQAQKGNLVKLPETISSELDPIAAETSAPSTTQALERMQQQAADFYTAAADHLCDYDNVIQLFRELADNSEKLAAELICLSAADVQFLQPGDLPGFNFAEASGGGSLLKVIQAELGTKTMLEQYRRHISSAGHSSQIERIRRRHVTIMTQTLS